MAKYEIDTNTIITKGLPISDNFILDHMTTGAYHYLMGQWAPRFTVPLETLLNKSVPAWQIASNLQMGAQGLLEPLLKEFGGDLIIRAGLSPSNLGKSFDIQIAGFQGNMFNVINDIQKLSTGANSVSLVQGASSFARLNFDAQSIENRFSNMIPNVQTIDSMTGTVLPGLQSIRGFI